MQIASCLSTGCYYWSNFGAQYPTILTVAQPNPESTPMINRLTFRAICFSLLSAISFSSFGQEICNNAWDDDFDGLTDLQDTVDCQCTLVVDTVSVTSIIPNPSFECYTSLPTTLSQLNNACNWVQATTPTTDYFVNQPGGYFPACVPTPLPSGNGNACVGGFYVDGWQEYLGTCLMSPLVAGTTYTLDMDVAMTLVDGSVQFSYPGVIPPTEVVIYGSNTCVALPLGTTNCPSVAPYAWDVLGTVAYTPNASWSSIQINFTPGANYDMVMIGPPCNLTAPFDWGSYPSGAPFMFYDGLTLNESSLFGASTIDMMSTDSLNLIAPGLGQSVGIGTGMVPSFCFNNIELVAHPEALNYSYGQWYLNGVTIFGATDTIFHLSQWGYGPGTYQFAGYYLGGASCSYSEITVDPDDPVVPLFSANVTSGCQPLNVQFTNNTDPAILASCTWDFGDGSPLSNTISPLHTYADSGTYDVSLTVLSVQGCTADTTYPAYIHVDQAPVASFTVDTLAGCGPLTVNFTNTTDPLWFGTCTWNLGSLGPQFGCPDFAYTFTVPGTYPVTLVVTSPGGCPSLAAGPVNITVHPDPQVLISSDLSEGCTPLAVQFNNDTDPALTDSVWWDLGNGITTDTEDPTNVYLPPGTYDVSLTVWSSQGCVGDTSITDMITVHGIPTPDFTNTPDSGCYDLEVDFTNLTDTASMASSFWTFGDGGTSIAQDPIHIFTTPGVYDVTLAVTSPDGCVGDTTFQQLITVFDHPVADFTMTPQPTDVFQTNILFLDASTSDVVAWDWTFGWFGVIGTSTEQYPVQHFPDQEPNEYPVELIVTNNHGCQDTLLKTVVIDPYFQVFVPNTFTPDGDGFNDWFLPVLQDHDVTQYHLYIYDRWGEKIFESSDYTNPWIGTYMNQGGELLPQGVYAWRLITAPSYDQKVRKEYFGHITLLK